jgi:hypothetical protein
MASARIPLADALGATLSANARRHLSAAGIARHPEHSMSKASLLALLLRAGFEAPEALLRLEERVGGAAFPSGRLLGVSCFLGDRGLRPRALPQLDGRALFPIFGNPLHLEDWESPFALLEPSGAIALFDAPAGPARAYASLEQFLEVEALAPFDRNLHRLRVDALCGATLADLVGAAHHPPASGAHNDSFVGERAWVDERRIPLYGAGRWSRDFGTFLLSAEVDILVDAMELLLGEGFTLGHQGPSVNEPPSGAPRVLSFTDAHPEIGHGAVVEVTVWGEGGAYVITRREVR